MDFIQTRRVYSHCNNICDDCNVNEDEGKKIVFSRNEMRGRLARLISHQHWQLMLLNVVEQFIGILAFIIQKGISEFQCFDRIVYPENGCLVCACDMVQCTPCSTHVLGVAFVVIA